MWSGDWTASAGGKKKGGLSSLGLKSQVPPAISFSSLLSPAISSDNIRFLAIPTEIRILLASTRAVAVEV